MVLNAEKVCGGSTCSDGCDGCKCERGAGHGAGQLGFFYFERTQENLGRATL